MPVGECVVCLAAEEADESNLQALVRWQAVKLDQARDALFPTQVELARAKDRIRELEETIKRQNKVILKANGRRAS